MALTLQTVGLQVMGHEMKTLFKTCLLLIGLSVAPAMAAELADSGYAPAPAAPDYFSPQSANGWGGFYGGVLGGYGAGRFNRGQAGRFGQVSGGDFGLVGGFRLQSNNLVGGLEADFVWANIDNNKTAPGPVISNASLQSIGTVRAKLGYVFDRLLVSGTVGLAGGTVRASLYDGSLPVPAGGPLYSDHRWRNGYTAGLGLEYAITNNVSARADYLYVNLRSRSLFTGAYAGATGMDLSLLRMGLNYRF